MPYFLLDLTSFFTCSQLSLVRWRSAELSFQAPSYCINPTVFPPIVFCFSRAAPGTRGTPREGGAVRFQELGAFVLTSDSRIFGPSYRREQAFP